MDPRPAAMRVVVCAKTDVGRARKTNEDACSITELASGDLIDAQGVDRTVDVGLRGILLALSDGMGGHQAGEVASALVLESLQAELRRDAEGPLEHHLENAVHRANRTVHDAAKVAERHGMGATLTAVFIRGTQAYIAEVGDSRGYLLRGGRLRQMTWDQSLVQMLVDQGVLSPKDARTAPGKNVILQAMGLDPDVRVAIGRLELRRADRLLLCSDGITNELTDDELRQILIDSRPREACETMVALANERGGRDNQTVIVADVLGEDLATPVEFETVTSTYQVLQAFQASEALGRMSPPDAPAAPPEPVEDDDEVEIQIEQPPAEEPARARQGWIQSLRNKLSRDRRR